MNIDENTMQNIKNMVDNGNISDAISQISPEMIESFSKMLSNQEQNSNDENQRKSENASQENNSTNTQNTMNIPDLNGIDMNTIMKMTSAFGKMNSKNDPRANLLNSLKPYLRDSKKGKLDNYMNLLNISKIADVMKDNNKTEK